MEVVIEMGIYLATSGIAFFGGLGIGIFITMWIMTSKEPEETPQEPKTPAQCPCECHYAVPYQPTYGGINEQVPTTPA